MSSWLKGHAWNVFVGIMLSAIAVGTWTEQLRQQATALGAMERRVNFLEDRFSNEQTRLSAVYMTRELSGQQYADIGRQLSEIKDELRGIRSNTRR